MIIRVEGLHAKDRPRFTKQGGKYTPKKTTAYEKKIRDAYIAAADKEVYMDGQPVVVVVRVYKQVLKSWSNKKKRRVIDEGIPPTTMPDVDNYLKIAMDGLNGLAYKDDRQVVNAIVSKEHTYAESYMTIEILPFVSKGEE